MGRSTEWLIRGQVLDPAGQPAPDIRVSGRPAIDAASLISNNSGGLIDGRANPLLDSRANPLLDPRGQAYRVQAEGLETRTDEQGRFTLRSPDGAPLNVEAVLSDTLKAIQLAVSSASATPTLRLAPTSTLAGRVTAPDAPLVSDFEGVEVFIPGTSYQARTDSSGRYTLSNVPAGTFSVVALNAGLGRAIVADVRVVSGKDVSVPDLPMTLKAPVIERIFPENGGPGARLTLSGREFGASSGKTFLVTFNGVIATSVQRIGDETIRVGVPPAAHSGDVVVLVNGVPSNARPFQVLKQVGITPGSNREVVVGSRLEIAFTGRDTEGQEVASPSVDWHVSGESLEFQGLSALARRSGLTRIQVSSGQLSAKLVFRVLNRAPRVETIAGDGQPDYQDGPGYFARFNSLLGVAVASDSTIYVVGNQPPVLRAIDPDGTVRTVAGGPIPGLIDAATTSARFANLTGVCISRDGSLLVADSGNGSIRRVTSAGMVSTVAGRVNQLPPGSYDAPFVDGASSSARFYVPAGLVEAPDGTLYVADMYNHRIRWISPAGVVGTLAGSGTPAFIDGRGTQASFFFPTGVALDNYGRVIVVDQGNHCIRRITADGMVTTIAGDATKGYLDKIGKDARFHQPIGVAIDPSGDIFIADLYNHLIRRVTTDGVVFTLAGAEASFKDGPVSEARFNAPTAIAVDPNSNDLIVTDAYNHRVRRIKF